MTIFLTDGFTLIYIDMCLFTAVYKGTEQKWICAEVQMAWRGITRISVYEHELNKMVLKQIISTRQITG